MRCRVRPSSVHPEFLTGSQALIFQPLQPKHHPKSQLRAKTSALSQPTLTNKNQISAQRLKHNKFKRLLQSIVGTVANSRIQRDGLHNHVSRDEWRSAATIDPRFG